VTRSSSWRAAFAGAAVLAVIAWALSLASEQARFIVGNDAIGYITHARNFISAKGLVGTPNELEFPDADLAPTRYHPPGFPLLIAGVSQSGLSVTAAAVAVSRVSWVLLPFALLFALRPILPASAALAVTALAVLSPGIHFYGAVVNTDVATLLLTCTATGLVLRGFVAPRRTGYLVMAGVLLGTAYALRNSVTAYYAALVVTAGAFVAFRQISIKEAFVNIGLIALGSLPILLALMARNLALFGEIQPYVLRVGKHGTHVDSARVYVQAMASDLTGSPWLGKIVAWDAMVFVLIALPLLLAIGWRLARLWPAQDATRRFASLLALSYTAMGAAMLVIAHTFHGLDFGNLLRHAIQYSWLILAAVALAASPPAPRALSASLAAALVLAAGARMWFIHDDLRSERELAKAFEAQPAIVEAATPHTATGRILTDRIKHRLVADEALRREVAKLPDGALIASNQGQLLGWLTDRSVRTLALKSLDDLSSMASALDHAVRTMRSDRPVYLVLVPDNLIVRAPQGAAWKEAFERAMPATWQTMAKDTNLLIVAVRPASAGKDLRP